MLNDQQLSNVTWEHFDEFPMELWRWPNFTPQEMACKGTHRLKIDPHSMDCLQALREMIDAPLVINSAFRSKRHNRNVGGATKSQHLLAKAFDIRIAGHDPRQLEAAARECGFTSFGRYPEHGFLHVDTRDNPAQWSVPQGYQWPDHSDDPQFAQASPAPEPEHADEPPATVPAKRPGWYHRMRRRLRA